MRTFLAGLICLGSTVAVAAQEPQAAGPVSAALARLDWEPPEKAEREEPLETDRDSFTPATKTVAKGRTILEAAYSFIDNRHDFETHSFPELLVRHGITDRIELRLGWNYEVGGSGSSVSGTQGLESLEGSGVERE